MSFGNGSTTFAAAMYGYDPTGRVETVGNATDTLTYAYVPGTGDIASSSWQTATLDTAYTYDGYKRLTNIAVNNVNVYGYTLNDKNQRTGATLPDGNTWSYSYDTLGQLTGAEKNSSAAALLKTFTYSYDLIGNRTSATEDDTTTSYTSNLVNQYTQIAAQIPTYDADGNLLTYNGWTYTWNGENRLIAAEKGTMCLEFAYDYMGRRLYKKVYEADTLTSHRKFVYDGYKLIAEFDALASDALLASYLWQPVGLDVPLMRVAGDAEEYYIVDGNKNVIALKDSSGADLSTYTYTPFGAVEDPVDGDENPFRFSSEYVDDETALVYYNYRYYSPALGRWLSRDPIEEEGGTNLYGMVSNNVLNSWDVLGYENVLGQIPGAPTGITWWHLEQEMKHRAKMPNSNFWYCERLLDSSGLSKAEQWSVRISTVQHAYVSVGPHPWSPQNGLRGYGFSGQAQKPGTYPLPESAFNPTRCRPCYKRTDTKSQLQHGVDKGTCCKDATDKQIENCISSAPIKREYSVNLFNLYVCWTWAEETLNECCLNCNNTFVKEGQFK